MKKKIVVVEPLRVDKEKVLNNLNNLENVEVEYYDNRQEDNKTLIKRCKKANIIVVSNIKLDKTVLEKCENLEMICVAFTGVDHIDMDYCREQGIVVSNASGYATQAVVELTFGLIFNLYRNIKIGDKEIREGYNHNNRLGLELANKQVGVVGVGAIGSEVVKLAQAFKADVSIYNRSKVNIDNTEQVDLESIFKHSDIISIHLPLNSETKGIINKELLSLMKEDAILINTARGPIIDNDYLAKILNEDKIAGAGIDVFDYEPPLKKDYPLLSAKNTILTPHIAYFTQEAMEKRFQIVLSNIEAYLNNRPINVM